jgi:aspartyl-tRNA(Asn)/glutamyl-tRNA(Gln) amidotransferase subunit C
VAGLSRTDVEHVAHLARLGLTPQEVVELQVQLNHILEQFAVLSELDTDSIPPTARVIDVENVLREDVVQPSLAREAALAGATDQGDGYVVVPAILGDDTDRR